MNRRNISDRRLLQTLMRKDERRHQIRRDLEEWRRVKSERRQNDEPIIEERRQSDRRAQEIEKLQADHPEFNLPVDPVQ